MEFWEGAVLVVGGLWLVGKISRQHGSVAHVMPTSLNPSLLGGAGNTVGTNEAGETSLVAGETLQAAPPLMLRSSGGIMVDSTRARSLSTSPIAPMIERSGGAMTASLRSRMVEL